MTAQRGIFRSMEGLSVTPAEAARGEGAIPKKDVVKRRKSKEKTQQPKKTTDIEAKSVGLQIYSAESNPFPRQISYEVVQKNHSQGRFDGVAIAIKRNFKFKRGKPLEVFPLQ